MTDNFNKDDLIKQVGKILKYHASLGIEEYPRTQGLADFLDSKEGNSTSASRTGDKIPATQRMKKKAGIQKHVFDPGLAHKATLNDVREEIGDCHRCSLHESRTSIVFGQGDENAGLMIIADAPSREDDLAGFPLQSEQGELLEKMLQAINLSRSKIYITTLVKCFPGKDAKPDDEAIRTCLPFLFRQIEIICPKVICTMGTQASQILLRSRRSLFQLRGRFYNFNDLCSTELADKIFVMPSLHPALLLNNQELKKASWQDLQMIQKKLQGA
jgi:DNA polymerase